jgi:flagellar hook protein FlgE
MDAFGIALSGLQAASASQQVTANNVANTLSDGYKAKRVERSELAANGRGAGVKADGLTEDPTPPAPGGSNVDLAREFAQSNVDTLLYTANLKVIQAEDDRFKSTLDLKA